LFYLKAYLALIGSSLLLLFSLLVLALAVLIAFTYRTKTNKIHNQKISVKDISTIETKKVQLMSINPFETLWEDQDKSNCNEFAGTDEKELKQESIKSLTNRKNNLKFKKSNDLAKTKRALKTLFDTN
jgi:hypothetical protein